METEKLMENINEINNSVTSVNETKEEVKAEEDVKEIDNLMESLGTEETKAEEVKSIVEPPKKNDTIDLEDEAIDTDIEIETIDKMYEDENNDIKPDYSKSPDYDKMEFDEEGNLVSFINKIDLESTSPVEEFNFNDENLKNIFFGKTNIHAKKEEKENTNNLSIYIRINSCLFSSLV